MSHPEIEIPGFEILEKLGEGGMGAVYKARQISLDRLVAIKTLPPAHAASPEYVEHFLREAKAEAALKNPHIVQIYSAGQAWDHFYIVMEFVAGETLSERLQRKGALEERDALAVAEAVARALDYAWTQRSVIHGDIKPGNIMVDDDGTIKIGDFLALTRPGGDGGKPPFGDSLIGTPNYMAPEQILGQGSLDFRTDMYGLGAVLYHMLSGRLPFGEHSGEDVFRLQLTAQLEDIGDLNPAIGDSVAWLLEKLLVKDAAARPASWSEVQQDVARVRRGEMPVAPLPAAGASTMKRRPQRQVPARPGGKKDRGRIRVQADPGKRAATPPAGGTAETPPRAFPLFQALCSVLLLAVLAFVFTLAPPPAPQDSPPAPEALQPAADEIATPPTEPPPPEEITPAPEREEAASETPAATFQDPAALARELQEYTSIMQEVLPLCFRRNYAAADALLAEWIARHPDHGYVAQAGLQRERVRQAGDLSRILLENGDNLIGQRINLGGARDVEIFSVSAERVVARRYLQDGEARLEMEFARMPERDWLRLLKAAAPNDFARNEAVNLIAGGKLREASMRVEEARQAGAEVKPLEEWIADWQRIAANIQAYRALDAIEASLDAGQAQQAQTALASARQRFGASEVMGWAEAPRLAALEERIRKGLSLPPASQPAPAEVPVSATAETGELTEDDEVDLSVLGEGAAQKIGITELKEQFVSLDGKLVRLSFVFRKGIEQVDANTYATDILDDRSSLRVHFPEEGLKWMRAVPQGESKTPRKVYGIVSAGERVVRLVGRTEKFRNDTQSFDYGW